MGNNKKDFKDLDKMEFDEMLEQGISFYREIRKKKSRLSKIKNRIREKAEVTRDDGQTTVEFEHNGHTVSVSFPTSKTVVDASNKEMESLKNSVEDLVFSALFEKTVSVSYRTKEDFEEMVGKLTDPLKKQEVEDAVRETDPTPRVNFPK